MANPFTESVGQMVNAVKGFVTNATKPERQEPGPGDVTVSFDTKADAPQSAQETLEAIRQRLNPLQMPEEEVQQWWERVERARTRRKARMEKANILLNEYLPIIRKSGEAETVKVMQHFRNVHSKIGMLFYRSPDLVLSPKDGPSMLDEQMPNPMAPMYAAAGKPEPPPLSMEDIVSVKQAVLQQKLGRDGIKANRLHDELLFDVLAWAGFGASKLGFRCVYKNIQRPKMVPALIPQSTNSMVAPAPVAGPPQMIPAKDPLTGQPIMESIPVPVYEEWYWRRFSPWRALWNDDLRSTRFDEDATWTGMEFALSPKQAMQKFGLTEADISKLSEDQYFFKHDGDERPTGLVTGVEICCKASVFTDEVHPQAMNQLVLIDGIKDRTVVWRPSPDQTFGPDGKLTKDSLIGFPYRFLTIRDLADSPFPPADSAFTNSEIKQLSTWRRQSIKLRDVAIGKYFFDLGVFDEEDVKLIRNGEWGEMIGVKDGALAQGMDKIFGSTPQVHQTQDDYRNQQIIQRDIDMTLGISANAAGVTEDTVRTATEIAGAQSALQGRNDKELSRVVDHYLDGARMIDKLLMRYATVEEYVEITGTGGAKRMQMWNNRMISGEYLYDIAPDSMMRVDTARDFQLTMQHWNLAAKSPLTNQEYFLRRMARQRGMDPNKAVNPPASLPQPKDDRVKVSMSVNGADLANPLVIALLIKMGLITPQEAALNQPVVPVPEGAADKADNISAHTASNSGGRENAPGARNFRDNMAGD